MSECTTNGMLSINEGISFYCTMTRSCHRHLSRFESNIGFKWTFLLSELQIGVSIKYIVVTWSLKIGALYYIYCNFTLNLADN